MCVSIFGLDPLTIACEDHCTTTATLADGTVNVVITDVRSVYSEYTRLIIHAGKKDTRICINIGDYRHLEVEQ